MRLKTYPNPMREDGSFTGAEIRQGLQWLCTDVTCPHCDKEQPVAMTGSIGGPCIRCGKRTDGLPEEPQHAEAQS